MGEREYDCPCFTDEELKHVWLTALTSNTQRVCAEGRSQTQRNWVRTWDLKLNGGLPLNVMKGLLLMFLEICDLYHGVKCRGCTQWALSAGLLYSRGMFGEFLWWWVPRRVIPRSPSFWAISFCLLAAIHHLHTPYRKTRHGERLWVHSQSHHGWAKHSDGRKSQWKVALLRGIVRFLVFFSSCLSLETYLKNVQLQLEHFGASYRELIVIVVYRSWWKHK